MTAWLIAATWKGSLLVLFVLLLLRVFRGRIPSRWAYALLLVALARLVLPVAPEAPFSIFNLAPRDQVAVTVERIPAQLPATTAEPRVELLAPQRTRSNDMHTALLAVWIAGALFTLARTLLQTIALRRKLRDAVPVTHLNDHVVAQLVDDCALTIGVRRPVSIAITSAVSAPALHGWRRPTLLLPPDFLSALTLEQLRFVTLHELAHVRRSDVVVNWAATVVHALHWFNPLVRLALARLAEERELACDALALECLASDARAGYGSTLLQLVDRLRQPALAPGLVGMTNTTKSQMKRRILMIANFQPQTRRSMAFAALVTAVALVTLTDASASEQLQPHVVPFSPAVRESMARLDAPVTLSVTSGTIETVLATVSSSTGMQFVIADGALDEKTRATRISLLAQNTPAHAVVIESLSALGLALRFTESGATVEKMGDAIRIVHSVLPAPGPNKHVEVLRAPLAGPGGELDVIIAAPPAAEAGGNVMIRKVDVERARVAGDGVTRTRLTFRGGQEGQPTGILELEVQDAASSAAH